MKRIPATQSYFPSVAIDGGDSGPKPLIPPDPPTDFVATVDSDNNGFYFFTWANHGGVQTSTEFWLSLNGAAYSLYQTVIGFNDNSSIPTIPIPDNEYADFKIRNVNSAGTSGFSNVVRLTQAFILVDASVAIDQSTLNGCFAFYEIDGANCPNYTSIDFSHLIWTYETFAIQNSTTLLTVTCPAYVDAGTHSGSNGPHFDNNSALTTISMPVLRIAGQFQVTSCGALTSISVPSLTDVFSGGITIEDVANLTTIDFSSLQTIQNGLFIDDGIHALTSLLLPALQSINGLLDLEGSSTITNFTANNLSGLDSVRMMNMTALTIISWPNLITINSDFQAFDCTALLTVNLPVLVNQNSGNMDLHGCTAMTSFHVNANTTWAADLDLHGCTSLTSFQINATATINGALNLQSCTSLITLSVPVMIAITQLLLTSCTSLTTISLPNLFSIGGSGSLFQTSGCTALTTISLPALSSIDEQIICDGCTSLTSVSLPSFVSGGIIIVDFHGCTSLTTWNAPNWNITDGCVINFNNCALSHTSIEQILHRGVAAGLSTTTMNFAGGTNAGLASLSAQGQADATTLTGNGCTMSFNP